MSCVPPQLCDPCSLETGGGIFLYPYRPLPRVTALLPSRVQATGVQCPLLRLSEQEDRLVGCLPQGLGSQCQAPGQGWGEGRRGAVGTHVLILPDLLCPLHPTPSNAPCSVTTLVSDIICKAGGLHYSPWS